MSSSCAKPSKKPWCRLTIIIMCWMSGRSVTFIHWITASKKCRLWIPYRSILILKLWDCTMRWKKPALAPQSSARLLMDNMFNKDILLLDIESTGTDVTKHEIIQLAAILLDKKTLKE